MKPKNYLTVIYHPIHNLGLSEDDVKGADVVELRKLCIKIRKYDNPSDALNAFADTPCEESELFDDVFEATTWGYQQFVKMIGNLL